MSGESFQEKTEAPTPKRRRDAAEKGQIPRSQEVTTAFLILAAGGVVAVGAEPAARSLVDLFGRTAMGITALPEGVEGFSGYLSGITRMTLAALLPLLLPLAGTALAVSAVQARGVVTLKPLAPQWERMNPLKKASQIWGMRALAELAKSMLRLGLIAAVVWGVLGNFLDEVTSLGQRPPMALLQTVAEVTARLLLATGGAYLLLALADYGYQVWQHERQLKMTREEVKKETKEAEGDQVMKVRRRTMARQMARRRMLRAVPDADVVVTNPTHIAVAIKYDPAAAAAPVVLAMGERKVAQRIKELARDSGVPVMENKLLARALLASAEVGRPIPVELFIAVAEVLAWVYRTQGRPAGAGAGTDRRESRGGEA